MADKARRQTDKILKEIENEISQFYNDAYDEAFEEWFEYMDEVEEKTSEEQSAYDKAVKEGNRKEIAVALAALIVIRKQYLMADKKAKAVKEHTAKNITAVNQGALAFLLSQKSLLYKLNYNQVAVQANRAGISFKTITDRIAQVFSNKNIKNKTINAVKDRAWNMKKINSSILQGMRKGESVQKIAKRIAPIMDNNMTSAIRMTRTKVTEIENRARLDSYKKLEEAGAVIKKRWLATGDGRTRDWHLDMNGQEVGLDEMFVDGLGNKLEFPGDSTAAPETVYNCRCSMESDITGIRNNDGSITMIDYKNTEPSQHDLEIEAEKERRKGKQK